MGSYLHLCVFKLLKEKVCSVITNICSPNMFSFNNWKESMTEHKKMVRYNQGKTTYQEVKQKKTPKTKLKPHLCLNAFCQFLFKKKWSDLDDINIYLLLSLGCLTQLVNTYQFPEDLWGISQNQEQQQKQTDTTPIQHQSDTLSNTLERAHAAMPSGQDTLIGSQ